MGQNRKVCQVSFDLDDPHEKALLDYVNETQKKFSPYVKRLIWMDMKANEVENRRGDSGTHHI